MVEKKIVRNNAVSERKGELLGTARKLFEQKYGKPPEVTKANGYRMEYVLDTPKSLAKNTIDSRLYELVRRLGGMRTVELNHGSIELHNTKIIGLGFVLRTDESWLSMTIANGNCDPFAVWIGLKGEYVATNSIGDAKKVTFGSESNEWRIGLFGELEELFNTSLRYDAGEIVCFGAPFAGPQLNKKDRL